MKNHSLKRVIFLFVKNKFYVKMDLLLLRCWFSGRIPAFQAGDKGSIPLRRTNKNKNLLIFSRGFYFILFYFYYQLNIALILWNQELFSVCIVEDTSIAFTIGDIIASTGIEISLSFFIEYFLTA